MLFTEDSFEWEVFPPFKEHEFTVYKNKKGYEYFKENDIPFDGSFWMYRVLSFEGDEVIQSLLKLVDTDPFKLECDPRARTSARWFLASHSKMQKVQMLFHIMGLREMLSASLVEIPEGVEVHE